MGDTHEPERFEQVESALKTVAMDLKLLSSALKVRGYFMAFPSPFPSPFFSV
jgi:hypothetical protein